jgi:hypothetical protein
MTEHIREVRDEHGSSQTFNFPPAAIPRNCPEHGRLEDKVAHLEDGQKEIFRKLDSQKTWLVGLLTAVVIGLGLQLFAATRTDVVPIVVPDASVVSSLNALTAILKNQAEIKDAQSKAENTRNPH